ncbi:hypothetical protein WA026_009315 [Henosepilachna vigintioctopunctata]|uniref:Uncharacterized protein n=1 Tax=Henosepilachna vigintioctopunctata TaxID=420089 RepID=A0AAW1UZ02_9CUCU
MSSDKRRISIVKRSQQEIEEIGLSARKQKNQVASKQGNSSDEGHLAYVKLSKLDLKDLGLLSDVPGSTQKTCKLGEKGTALGERHLPYVKLSQSDLKDLGLLSGVSENAEKTCKLDNKLGEEQPRKRRIFPSPHRKSVSSIRKTKNSTIRRSTVLKKETKKKDMAKVNIFLSNNSNGNKKNNGNISNKITGTVKQVEIELSGARKELFKTPSLNPSKTKSVNHRGDAFNGNMFESPLIDEEKAEILLKKVPCIQKSIFESTSVSQKFLAPKLSIVNEEAPCVSPSTSGATVENIAGDSSYANSEFEQDEKICEQEQISHDYSNKIALICDMLKKDEEDFQRYNDSRKKRIDEIYKILNDIQKCCKLEVESQHILDKKINQLKTGSNIDTCSPSKLIQKGAQCSPNLRNAQNLRINVLKTNFGRNCTPKEKKAQNMYNDLRKTFSLLETPKSIKTIEERKGNISLKLQEQCLLLLETPKH